MSTPPTPAERLRDLLGAAQPSFTFFWAPDPEPDGGLGPGCLSQWWPAAFVVEETTYATAEHWMMAEKARTFGDPETLARILSDDDPAVAKRLGREVRGFDSATWERCRYDAVVRGNRAKFAQHPALARYLRSTGTDVLVEASPDDTVWGIGLAAGDPAATSPAAWRGRNLLGFALMEVRDT